MKTKPKAELKFVDLVNPPAIAFKQTSLQLRRQMCQPIERKKLTSCLKLLGLWPIPAWSRGFNGYQRTFRPGPNSPSMAMLSLKDLYDLHDLARIQWLVLYKRYQIQTGENHGIGVWLNALWIHVKKLFRRMGVEPGCS